MGPRDTSSGERAANREVINSLLGNRHARKDMLNGLFREHFSTPSTIRCELEDHVIHLDPRDSTITPAILEKGHWNRDELERAIYVLRENGAIHEGGTFVDVGANIGTQTLYALLSGALMRAHAFEPDPSNADLLRGNLDDNGMEGRVSVYQAGVSDRTGLARLHRHPHNLGGHSFEPPENDGAASGTDVEEVEVVSLDTFFDGTAAHIEEVGLVWIDVEGHEPSVIRGATGLLSRSVPLVFEFLERDRQRDDFARMFSTLQHAYTHVLCLQDPEMSVRPSNVLGRDLPEGDYLVFSIHD